MFHTNKTTTMKCTVKIMLALFVAIFTAGNLSAQYVMKMTPSEKQKILSYAKDHNSNNIRYYKDMNYTNYIAPSTRRYAIEYFPDSVVLLSGLAFGTRFIDSAGGVTSDNLYSVIISPEIDSIRLLVLDYELNITQADIIADMKALLATK